MKKRDSYIGKRMMVYLLTGCIVWTGLPSAVMAGEWPDGVSAADMAEFGVDTAEFTADTAGMSGADTAETGADTSEFGTDTADAGLEALFSSEESEESVLPAELFGANNAGDNAEEVSGEEIILGSSPMPTVVENEGVLGSMSIYANGTALIISGSGGGTTIYIDTNRNGTIDHGEQTLKEAGIFSAPENGADLSGCSVYGGSNGNLESDTLLTMTGGKLQEIYGGCKNGILSGSACVNMSGGISSWVIGGGVGSGSTNMAQVKSTEVTISGSAQTEYVYGVGGFAIVEENTKVMMNGGTVTKEICGGGNAFISEVRGNTELIISGGTVKAENGVYFGVYGGSVGGGHIGGNVRLEISGGAIINPGVSGLGADCKADGSSSVVISGGTFAEEVYGAGGNGAECASSSVTISGGQFNAAVFGGANNGGKVSGNTNVTVTGGSFSGSIFGGGFKSSVQGSSKVTIKNTEIQGAVYGGGHSSTVIQNSAIEIYDSKIVGKITAGGYNGTVTGTKSVNIGGKVILPMDTGGICIGGGEGTEYFTIDKDKPLTEDSVITAVLSDDYIPGTPFAKTAVSSNLEQVNITGSGAASKAAYFSEGELSAKDISGTAAFAVNVTVKKDEASWEDSQKKIRLKAATGELYKNGTDLSAGTYDIYDGDTDTGKDVTVIDAAVNHTLDYYTVTFYDGTTAYTTGDFDPQIIVSGKNAAAPQSDPVKSGYVFNGWKTDVGGYFNFTGTAINAKTDLYASWSYYVPSYRPYISTETLLGGAAGAVYEQKLTAGGDTPIIWSIDKGFLPEGLSLSEEGVLSGTPKEAGTFTFTVKAENRSGSDTKELRLVIVEGSVIEGIAITPENAIVNAGGTKQFSAVVTGKYEPDQEVIWSVEGSDNKETLISEDGLLKIAGDEKQDNLTVRAVSAQNKEISAAVSVSVSKAPIIVDVEVSRNRTKAVLASNVSDMEGYDFVIGKDADCIKTKKYMKVNKNILNTATTFTYVDKGTYYAYCHAWRRDADGKKVFGPWSNGFRFQVTSTTPQKPEITKVTVNKDGTVTVAYKKCRNATGYDLVLGSSARKVEGELRPVKYGELVKKVYKGNVVKATFKNVPKGTYYVGLHAYNRTGENRTKVFSMWSGARKIKVS